MICFLITFKGGQTMANLDANYTNCPGFLQNTPTPPSFDLISITRIAALLLSLASMILSSVFGWQLGTGSLLLSATFALMLIALALSEFLAASYVSLMYQHHDLPGLIVAVLILVSGIAISVVAGQSLVNLKMAEIEEQRRVNSDAYKTWQTQQAAAAERAKTLAVSDAEFQQAQKTLTALNSELNAYFAQPAKNSRGQNAGQNVGAITSNCTASNWYARQYCPKARAISAQIAQQQTIVDKHAQYLAAKQHAAEIENQKPSTGTVDATHPGIASLSILFETTPQIVKARVLFFLSLCVELFAIGLWFMLHRSSTRRGSNNTPPTAPPFVEASHTQSVPYAHNEGITAQTAAPNNMSPFVEANHAQSVPYAHNEAITTPPSVPNNTPPFVEAAHTQSASHAHNKDITTQPSVPNNTPQSTAVVYETLKNGVLSGQITNLSFKSLAATLGVSNNKIITELRDQLVAEKLAMYDDTRKCLPIPQ
jgi:hypothetical protein